MTVPPSGDPYAAQPPTTDDQPGGTQPDHGATTTTAPQAPYPAPAQPYGAPEGVPSPYATGGGERPPLDGVSVAALVTGILTLGIVPLVLGIVGLVRTKDDRRRGKGFAITGVVLGALSTVGWTLLVLGLAAFFTSDEVRSAVTEGYTEGINQGAGTDLEIGECFDLPADVADPLVHADCAAPHTAETFVIHDITATEHPGEDGIDALAEEHCLGAFESYVGTPYEESTLDIYLVYPSDVMWAVGDRRLLCGIVAYDGSMLEGPVAGSGL